MTTLTTTRTAQIILAAAMAVGSASAFAQTSSTPTMPAMGNNPPATAVGVTPQTAAEANRQAVPRSDTGTVVRTSPNAADSARSATGMTGSTDTTNSTGTGTTMRTARADRN